MTEQQTEAPRFGDIFARQFAERADRERAGLKEKWDAGGPEWTNLMLGPSNGESVLEKAVQEWSPTSSLHHNWYTIDLMSVHPPFCGETKYWQTSATAIVEHENGKDIETELWKLTHWRAPLKVLVFYRFGEGWLTEKIRLACKLIAAQQSHHKEQDADYLLIVGQVDGDA